MLAVIFEVYPIESGMDEYLAIAASLREFLQDRPGFISIERFQSFADEHKLLSLSFWESEEAIEEWRNVLEHRAAQQKGRRELFSRYRIRVAQVVRDYTESERTQAPSDSNAALVELHA
ncbi:MAG: antibiotic biosynthesis monooxygenase [Anaerolineales bacterium]|jgi:heme-degrading monooxygenase HmoA|nr:antibiotic biosynthesis monooxygenase [Anaerolineales bacterium]